MPVADVQHAALLDRPALLDAATGEYAGTDIGAEIEAEIEADLAALLGPAADPLPRDPAPRDGREGPARARRPAATAHPLVSKDTASLVAEALAAAAPASPGALPAAPGVPSPPPGALPVPDGDLPGRMRACLPHWVHSGLGTRRRRPVTVEQHLLLTERVLRRTGWAATGRRDRTAGGRRCILGAQHLLHSLGYGDVETARRAGEHIDRALAAMGQSGPFWVWNDQPHVHEALVHRALRRAALLSRP
ncbi:hypothetical protein GQS52_00700 [Streptomyces sp. SCUT-3]|uniref:DUF6197 family protein n=1 Tax=Streptomyces TaxID=1883 RepID=UPI0015FD3495|nr:hypothetical protein [Streptomyces sp. SCUT-3]QMV20568.1 hypothetical protein GQS52_00700 [Streptomyces sp. SCUT-3]